jgi:endonuclease YncB( thermonuclease family)
MKSQVVLLICCVLCLCWTTQAEHVETITGKVVAVTNGDSFTLLDDGQTARAVKLHGIAAPELEQPFGQASKRKLSALILGKTVTVEKRGVDRNERTLGVICQGGQDINLAQLSAGLAWLYWAQAKELNASRRQAYSRAELEAKQAKLGLWVDAVPISPWLFRPSEKAQARALSSVLLDPHWLIIGNRASQIYHRADCPDYLKVNKRDRVHFETEQEAQAADYRKATNCP